MTRYTDSHELWNVVVVVFVFVSLVYGGVEAGGCVSREGARRRVPCDAGTGPQRKKELVHTPRGLSLTHTHTNIQYVCMKTHRESENYLRGQVSTKRVGMMVDSACRDRTASWVRQQAQDGVDIELCDWFEVLFTRR